MLTSSQTFQLRWNHIGFSGSDPSHAGVERKQISTPGNMCFQTIFARRECEPSAMTTILVTINVSATFFVAWHSSVVLLTSPSRTIFGNLLFNHSSSEKPVGFLENVPLTTTGSDLYMSASLISASVNAITRSDISVGPCLVVAYEILTIRLGFLGNGSLTAHFFAIALINMAYLHCPEASRLP